MLHSVFISGSIAIKSIPNQVVDSITKMIEKNLTIFVGDASGIDTLVQDLCSKNNYFNVVIYTITSSPRYIANNNFDFKYIFVDQEIKKERERQKYKDRAMTDDSEYSLVVWDGTSKGSYSNILRSIEQEKPIKVYYQAIEEFISPKKITEPEISYIYRENNGYTASEVVKHLQENGIKRYKRSQDLNKFLLSENLLTKEGTFYQPTDKNPDLFIIEMYKGKPHGVKFKNDFIDWIEEISKTNATEQPTLFD